MVKMHERIKLVSTAIALMAVLSATGTGWAKKNSGGGGSGAAQGTFTDATRTNVSVSVTVPADEGCVTPTPTTPATETYSVKAYIFQPSGRMFAIGISEPTNFTCSSTAETPVPVMVKAFPGLDFKPGPATLLFKVIATPTSTGTGTAPTPAEDVIYEYGSRVDLH